jgi:hypothetical protein
MDTPKSCYLNQRKKISCALSTSIILMAASGIAPASSMLFPVSPCLAATITFPAQWTLDIVSDLAKPTLTQADLTVLNAKGSFNGTLSFVRESSVIQRVNSLAAQKGIPYRLNLVLFEEDDGGLYKEADPPVKGKTYKFNVEIINAKTGRLINAFSSYSIGDGTYDK